MRKWLLICMAAALWAQQADAKNIIRSKPAIDTISFENLPPSESQGDYSTHYLAKIADQSGKVYFLQDHTYLNQGYYTIGYNIINQADPKDNKTIYESTADPENGGCYHANNQNILTQRNISPASIKSSYENHKLLKADVNGNKVQDLILLISEQNCETKNSRYVGFVISPLANGLNATPISAGDK